MQIPASSAAAHAAAIVSQAAAKDRIGEAHPANLQASAAAAENPLEKSDESNPDRDAQGQGDGLPHSGRPPTDQVDLGADEGNTAVDSSPSADDSPEGGLDIVA